MALDILLDCAGGPNGLSRVLGRRRQKSQRWRGSCDDRIEVRVAGCEKDPIADLKRRKGARS